MWIQKVISKIACLHLESHAKRAGSGSVRFHRSGSVYQCSLFCFLFLLFRLNDCSQFAVCQILVGCTWCRCLLPASTSPGCCLLFSTLLSVIYTETCCQVQYDKSNISVLMVFFKGSMQRDIAGFFERMGRTVFVRTAFGFNNLKCIFGNLYKIHAKCTGIC